MKPSFGLFHLFCRIDMSGDDSNRFAPSAPNRLKLPDEKSEMSP